MNMQTKLIAFLVLLATMAGACTWFGSHERAVGASSVQAKWDAAIATAKATSATQTLDWTKQFSAIGAQYEAASHVQTLSIADTVAADVRAGTLQLRDEPAQACAGSVSASSARSRAADAAATQALADRVQAAIAAVRAGDEADARERLLSAQVTALQAVLKAERTKSP